MIILPAIDLLSGCAVRLYRGDYEQKTVYSNAPEEVAKAFASAGAEYIHVVDLDGAKTGELTNLSTIEKIVRESGLKVEVGGGIRSMESIDRYMKIGVTRVILGTAAVKNRDLLCSAVAKYGNAVAVGADLSDGYVAIDGWLNKTEVTADEFFSDMESIGVKTVICTDISRDGAMKGTNHELYRALSEKYKVNIIASGGVSSLDDVKRLAALGIYGAIIGKAYYTGAIDLYEALEAAK